MWLTVSKALLRSKNIYRNKINHLLKISKKQFYNAYFLQNIQDSKRVWSGIRQIIHSNPKSYQEIAQINNNNVDITEPNLIANTFNNYFVQVGSKLASEIPAVAKTHLDYLKSPLCNSFFLSPTTTNEIEKVISSFKCGKATGPFSIPTDVLKTIKTTISKPLEIIFNESFETGIVPSNLKIANVIPIYKKGSQTLVENYRPISLLSIFNKILEKLMYTRLLSFLNKEKVLFEKQFGFRSKYSTHYALLSIVDKIQRSIDEREIPCGIILDLSKAFDTVNHTILFEKLDYCCIRGVAKVWFASYKIFTITAICHC